MAVTYDRNSFLINGERVFLTSASLHYFRIPRALWRDRLEQVRQAGMNTVQFYVAWNWHERENGVFDWTDERDLEHFISLAVEMGFYLVARPGPYICAEWEFGGFPTWLMQIAGIRLRRYDPVYLQFVDRYFENVLPLITRYQVGHPLMAGKAGGVIMVQAENELALVSPDDASAYMKHLVALYRRLGVTVPINTCEGGAADTIECVNSHTPADRFAAYRKKQPDAPLHCTEFWSGWYATWDRPLEQYPRSSAQIERETWRILAHGGAGYNYYMWHGGTNFGYTTMYLQTTSYDYDAPLGEAGGTWEKTRRTRRVARFAQTFSDILTNATEGDLTDIETDTTLGANFFQRVSEHGTALFVENPKQERIAVYLLVNGVSLDLFVPPESVRPVVYNVPLGGEAVLALCTAGVLGMWTTDDVTQIVVYGESGVVNRGVVAFALPTIEEPKVTGALTAEFRPFQTLAVIDEEAEAEDPEMAALLDAEESGLPLDAVQTRQEPPPIVPDEGGLLIFTVGFSPAPQEARFTVGGHTYQLLTLPTELADKTWWDPDTAANQLPVLHIGANRTHGRHNTMRLGLTGDDTRLWRYAGGQLTALDVPELPALPIAPVLHNWEVCDAEDETRSDFDDSRFAGMFTPTNRVFLDAQPGYAWYRAGFESDMERDTTLTFTAFADRIVVYLNGEFVTSTLPPGEERVADPSLTVPVRLRAGRNTLAVLTDNLGHVKGAWQFRGRAMEQDKKGLFGDVLLDYSRRIHDWRFLPGLSVERDPDNPRRADVSFSVNGPIHVQNLNWQPFSATSPGSPSWDIVEPGLRAVPTSMPPLPEPHIGNSDDNDVLTFSPSLAGKGSGGRLRYYRATFGLSRDELNTPGRELMLYVSGMGKGVIWVNGTNLGRFWTWNGHTRYFVPKCWLAENNTLVLFEEEGCEPADVRIVWDERANIALWREAEA